MNQKKQLTKYIVSDTVSAIIAWFLFFLFRRVVFENVLLKEAFTSLSSLNLHILFLFIPGFWLFVNYFSGYYTCVFRKSRLSEFFTTLIFSFFGCLVIFFLLLFDGRATTYNYYISFFVLFGLHFLFTYIGRISITQHATKKIHHRVWALNTLIIGTGGNAKSIVGELNAMKQSMGNRIVGFISTDNNNVKVDNEMVLGTLNDLDSIIINQKIKEIIIAVDNSQSELVFNILGKSYKYNVEVKTIPSLHEIINGNIHMSTIYAMPLVSLSANGMPYWQRNVKRILDIFFSVFFMITLFPVFLFIAIKVKLSSPGSIFYTQERIGKHGKPFNIIKFRTMIEDSESTIPLLTSEDDERVTPFGKILRKYRLDELPQFWNVLKGDMSIVGYRPERQFFIDQIVEQAPHYYLLQKIHPGITSWGMVKYGYADNVDKMAERLEYDIIYIENLSLTIDLKIIIYTFKIIFTGRGI